MDQNVEILPTHVRLWTNKRHPIHVCIYKYIGRNLPYDISTALYKYSIMFPQIAAVSKGLIYFVYSTQLMVGYIPKGMLAKHYMYPIHNTPIDQQQEDGHFTAKTHNSGLWHQKQPSRIWISNYILQNTVGCNFLSMPWIPATGTKVINSMWRYQHLYFHCEDEGHSNIW